MWLLQVDKREEATEEDVEKRNGNQLFVMCGFTVIHGWDTRTDDGTRWVRLALLAVDAVTAQRMWSKGIRKVALITSNLVQYQENQSCNF